MCGGSAVKPGTDNFELKRFVMQGVQYWSAEQAYQALKMQKRADRERIAKLSPKKGESSWNHGMRVWQKGQFGKHRRDWEAVKVEAMYYANKLKIEQNADCLASLTATTGPISHMGSGAFWDHWNPVLLTVIREELRPGGGDEELLERLWGEMHKYRGSKGVERSFVEEMQSGEPSPVADAPAEDTAEEAVDEDEDEMQEQVETVEPEQLMRTFSRWDTNSDGFISPDEMLAVIVDVGLASDELPALFEAADADKDGNINFEEFVPWLMRSAPRSLRDAALPAKVA